MYIREKYKRKPVALAVNYKRFYDPKFLPCISEVFVEKVEKKFSLAGTLEPILAAGFAQFARFRTEGMPH